MPYISIKQLDGTFKSIRVPEFGSALNPEAALTETALNRVFSRLPDPMFQSALKVELKKDGLLVKNPSAGSGGGGTIPVNRPPVNKSLPFITGVAKEGQTLTCSTGVWNNDPTTFEYQWYRNGTIITGAINTTRILTLSDVNAIMTCVVSVRNTTGKASATTLPTVAIVGATVALPVNTAAPAVTGSTTVGSTLTSSNGTWTNSPTGFTYQWRRDGLSIDSAINKTYVLVDADAGCVIACRVTAVNAGGAVPILTGGIMIPAVVVTPVAPTVTLGRSDGRISVGFVDGPNGGVPITGHKIWTGSTADNLTLFQQFSTATPYVLSGLTNGVGVFVAVSSINANNVEGPRSAVKKETPSAQIAQFTNPVIGVLAGSRGRQMANNPKNGDDVTSKGGGLISYVSFQDPRIGTILFQAPGDAWQNSAGMGGTVYADDGDGFSTYTTRLPRILTSKADIIFMDLSSNSVQNGMSVQSYTNSAKNFVTRMRDAGKVVLVGSCVMRNSAAGGAWGLGSDGRSQVMPLNAEMKAWCATQLNVEFIDGFSEFCDPSNNYEPFPWAVRDGTHYGPQATWIWAKLINAAVAKYIVASGPYNPVINNLHPNPTFTGDVAVPSGSTTANITGTLPTGLNVAWDAGQSVTSSKDSKVKFARVPGTNRWRLNIDRSAMSANVEGIVISLAAPPVMDNGKSYQAFMDVNFEPTTDSGWSNTGSISIRHAGETASGLVPMTTSETPLGDFDGGGGMPMPVERIKGRMWTPELRCINGGSVASVYQQRFWWRKGDQTPLQVEFENPVLAEVKDGRQIYFDVNNTEAPVFTSPATITFPEETVFTHQFTSNRTGVYSIKAGIGDAAMFAVGRNTGLSTAVTGVLDFDQERSPTYTYDVVFTPYDYRQASITQSFTLNLTDIDDGFTDLFTGAVNGTPLDQRTNWSLAGGASGALITSSSAVTYDNTKGVGACFAPLVGDSADQEIRFALSSNASGPTACLKLIDEKNYIGLRCASSTMRIMAVVNGGITWQVTLPTLFNPNSTVMFIAQQIGNIIRVYQADALIYTIDISTLTAGQMPDVLRNCKRSGIMSTAPSGNIRIDNWNNRVSVRRADKIYLKGLTVALTGSAGVDYASDIVNYSPTGTRSMGIITGPNNDVIVDGLTLRVQKPVAGTTTVQIIEDDPTAANNPRTTTVTITFA